MKAKKRALSVLLVAGMILGTPVPGLWATSAVPEPGAVGIPIDPNASGTKVVGPLSLAYDFGGSTFDCPLFVNNVFVVLRLKKGVDERTFNGDFGPVCSPADTRPQVTFVFGLISGGVMQHFFGFSINPCVETAGIAPCWAVKSVTSLLSSGTGAVSMDIDLAVKL